MTFIARIRPTATSMCGATPSRSKTADPCGVYFGTTGGQVYAPVDEGDGAAAVTPLPAAVGEGTDPFYVVGAMAGG
jgi:hypothetical protein